VRWGRKRRVSGREPIDIRLAELGTEMRKQHLACACCGYDAEWVLRLGKLERLFCERDLLNVLFDALNANVPATA
jgi:hypothetical protein